MRTTTLLLLCLFWQSSPLLASNQWTQRADFGSFGRHRGTGVGFANKAYVGTGHLNGTGIDTWYADWWEYDPATNAWGQKADYPGNFGNGDQDITSITLGDYVFAGLGQLDGNRFFKFDPQTNLWTQVSSPPATNSFNNTFPFAIGTNGYYPALFSSMLYKYDSILDTWTLINTLPFSTTWGVQCIAINNKGYIKNGTFLYEYDPIANTFTTKAPYPGSTPERPRVFQQNGNAFFIGGMDFSWTWSSEVWRYNPNTDSWFQMDDFEGSTRRWAVALNIGNRAYYGLGTNGTNFHDFWEFDALASLDKNELDGFKTYPNPAQDLIEFTSKDHQEFQITISNIMGQIVNTLVTKDGHVLFKRTNESSGTYFFNVIIDGTIVHSNNIVLL